MGYESLSGIPLFFGIEQDKLDLMLECLGAVRKNYAKNDLIPMENKTVKSIGLVLSGMVHIVKEDIWGNRTILAIIERGGLIAESFACGSAEHLTVSFFAAKKTELLLLPFSKVITSCSNNCSFHHQLIHNMVTLIADKNQQFLEKIEVTSKRTLREKILAYLSMHAQKSNSLYFDIPLGRIDFADYLYVNRSSLTRELNAMREDGLIDFEKNTFRIL